MTSPELCLPRTGSYLRTLGALQAWTFKPTGHGPQASLSLPELPCVRVCGEDSQSLRPRWLASGDGMRGRVTVSIRPNHCHSPVHAPQPGTCAAWARLATDRLPPPS